MSRIAFQSASRSGAVSLLQGYVTAASLRAQVYRARPKQVKAPCFYVERLDEVTGEWFGTERQRLVSVFVRALWGRFDDGEAADQRDAFADGFADYIADNFHAFDPNAVNDYRGLRDEPDFDFDGESFYSSVIELGGLATT